MKYEAIDKTLTSSFKYTSVVLLSFSFPLKLSFFCSSTFLNSCFFSIFFRCSSFIKVHLSLKTWENYLNFGMKEWKYTNLPNWQQGWPPVMSLKDTSSWSLITVLVVVCSAPVFRTRCCLLSSPSWSNSNSPLAGGKCAGARSGLPRPAQPVQGQWQEKFPAPGNRDAASREREGGDASPDQTTFPELQSHCRTLHAACSVVPVVN